MKTLLIDYGSGNLRSCAKSLEITGFNLQVSSNPKDAQHADALVLPGQGHFRQVMESFLNSGFENTVRNHIKAGKPFLGICVGMQILFDSSEESEIPGLGILKGRVQKFPKTELSVPQMQWNTLEMIGESPLMQELGANPFAYFVHSYYAPISNYNGAKTDYGLEFLSVVSHENVQATQFHPEKSQKTGLKMLSNFKNWAARA